MIVFGADFCFAGVYFFFSCHEISELCWLIARKFCVVIGSVFDFIILVQNFGGPLQVRDLPVFGEESPVNFGSSNYGDLDAESYPSKSTFGKTYFGP